MKWTWSPRANGVSGAGVTPPMTPGQAQDALAFDLNSGRFEPQGSARVVYNAFDALRVQAAAIATTTSDISQLESNMPDQEIQDPNPPFGSSPNPDYAIAVARLAQMKQQRQDLLAAYTAGSAAAAGFSPSAAAVG